MYSLGFYIVIENNHITSLLFVDRVKEINWEGFKELSKLKHLYLPGTEPDIPSDLFTHLPSLESLILLDNSLKSIPFTIGKLVNLKELILATNRLTSLPSSICELKNLEELDLLGNYLKKLPEQIGKLS